MDDRARSLLRILRLLMICIASLLSTHTVAAHKDLAPAQQEAMVNFAQSYLRLCTEALATAFYDSGLSKLPEDWEGKSCADPRLKLSDALLHPKPPITYPDMPVPMVSSRIHLTPATEEQFSISVVLNGKQKFVWPINPTPLHAESLPLESIRQPTSTTIVISLASFCTNCFLLYLFVFRPNFNSSVSFLGFIIIGLTMVVAVLSLPIVINSAAYRGSEVGSFYSFFAWLALFSCAYIFLATFFFALPQRFKAPQIYSWWEILGLGAVFALAQMMVSIFLNARYFPLLNSQSSFPLFVLNTVSFPVLSVLLTIWLARQRWKAGKI